MGTTLICKKFLILCMPKKILGICIVPMLNCINFMKIEEKYIMQPQISMHLAQELLSYFELRNYESKAPNRTTVCFYKKFWL